MEGELYKPLPAEVLHHEKALLVKQQDSQEFLQSFLRRNHRKEDEIEQVKYKTQQLDNLKQAGPKSKRDFDRRGGKRHTLTAREKRQLGVFQLNKKDTYVYDDYLAMNALWCDYIEDLIGHKRLNKQSMSQVTVKLLKADYHGSLMSVIRSKCPTYVGTTGIVIQETKNTFKMITKENKLKEPRWSLLLFDSDGCTLATRTVNLHTSDDDHIEVGQVRYFRHGKDVYLVEVLALADTKQELNGFERDWQDTGRSDAIVSARSQEQVGNFLQVATEELVTAETQCEPDDINPGNLKDEIALLRQNQQRIIENQNRMMANQEKFAENHCLLMETVLAVKVIPKANSVFVFEYGGYCFQIYGNQFRVHASDRVRKSFKLRATVDL